MWLHVAKFKLKVQFIGIVFFFFMIFVLKCQACWTLVTLKRSEADTLDLAAQT